MHKNCRYFVVVNKHIYALVVCAFCIFMCVDLVQRDCDAAAAVNVNYRYLRSCSPFNANKLFVLFVHSLTELLLLLLSVAFRIFMAARCV